MTGNEIAPLAASIKQAGAALGVGKSTIYKLIGTGELESTLIGTRRVIVYESLKALLRPAAGPKQEPARNPPRPPTGKRGAANG